MPTEEPAPRSGNWWDDVLSPYPGWMPEDEGRAYESHVAGQFVNAMSALAASVCVIAATNPTTGERFGMTATAVCSLSTEPPQLVVCLNRNASVAGALTSTGWLTVNILAQDQADLAGVFAGRGGLAGEARFAHGSWRNHTTGAPVLEGSSATCVCHVSAKLQQATHLLVVGTVIDAIVDQEPPRPPLMYHLRRFTELAPAHPQDQ